MFEVPSIFHEPTSFLNPELGPHGILRHSQKRMSTYRMYPKGARGAQQTTSSAPYRHSFRPVASRTDVVDRETTRATYRSMVVTCRRHCASGSNRDSSCTYARCMHIISFFGVSSSLTRCPSFAGVSRPGSGTYRITSTTPFPFALSYRLSYSR